MDPVSVLSIASVAGAAAKAAWNVGVGLHTFFSHVRTIDQNVDGLVAEVKALSNACACVHQRLRDDVRDYEADGKMPRTAEDNTWARIETQVRASQQSIAQLEAAFNDVRKQGTNKLSQAWRQFMINIHARDIDEARNRIHSHTTSLQIILQTATTKRADQQFRTLLSTVEECKAQVQELQQGRDRLNQDITVNELDILSVSEDALSSGESLYAASLAENSQGRFSAPFPGLSNIQQWMADLSAIEETVSGLPSDKLGSNPAIAAIGTLGVNVNGRSEQRDSRGSTSAVEYDSSRPTRPAADGAETNSDDEFEVEVAQEALAAAQSSFDSYRFQEADSYLKEALVLVRELPAKRRSACDTWNLTYMLGVHAYNSQRPADAESKLLGAIDLASRSRNASDAQLRQVYEAGHLLSQLYIKLGNLDDARLYCENALKGRRQLLGKSHDDTYRSIALMARIHRLIGKQTRAAVCLRFIDADNREELERSFNDLTFDAHVSDAYHSAKLRDEPDSSSLNQGQVNIEDHELNAHGSLNEFARVESRAPVDTGVGGSNEMRASNTLPTICTIPGEVSADCDDNIFPADANAVSVAVPSNLVDESMQQSPRTIVVCTRLGEFSMAVSTNLEEISHTFSPQAWNAFTAEINSGTYNDMSLHRQERVRRETFIESSCIRDLKLTINPSTKDFVLEQKKTRALRVEGQVCDGKAVITKIMMYRLGVRKGGPVEAVSLQIREVA